MATGMARGAAARGAKIAFGDGHKLIWGPFCETAFRNNPNIARRADEPGVEWIGYYKGSRQYNRFENGRWIWNFDFKAPVGEFFFDERERQHTVRRRGAVLIEPNVPWHKQVAANKDWGLQRFQHLVDLFRRNGVPVYQPRHGLRRLDRVEVATAPDFRCAVAALAGFDLVVTPEGGLHHAAAAVGVPAVVLFGGFAPPAVLGYAGHQNLTGGATSACGSLRECPHCRAALGRITVEEVFHCGRQLLDQGATAPARDSGIRGVPSRQENCELS